MMRTALTLLFSVVFCWGCGTDVACEPLRQHASQLARRLALPGETHRPEASEVDPARALTPPLAKRMLQEVELLEGQLPRTAKSEDLDVILGKLENRRTALQQSLRDFLAIEPERLQGGLESGDTMPIRRGVVMSRNALLAAASTAEALCAPSR